MVQWCFDIEICHGNIKKKYAIVDEYDDILWKILVMNTRV